jgi:hypothetical protein
MVYNSSGIELKIMIVKNFHSCNDQGLSAMRTGQKKKQKIKCLSILLFGIIFLQAGGECFAADIFVDDNTCPQEGTGTAGDPFCAIQAGINAAASGDTVYVHTGTYDEQLSMKTGVTLRNITSEQPKISSTAAGIPILFDAVDNVTLEGFLIDYSSTPLSQTEHTIIKVAGPGNGIVITNCEITGAQNAADSVVWSGIRLNGQLGLQIIANTITNTTRAGISTADDTLADSSITIQGNTIDTNGSAGIHLVGTGTGNTLFIGGDGTAANTISNNGQWGTAGAGIRLKDLQGVSIDNNNIFSNGLTGILLEDVTTAAPHISRNSIHNNFASGINIGGASPLTVGSNNEIYQNGLGGITFFIAENQTIQNGTASSAAVTISGNSIHDNEKAGISVIDNATGVITVDGNTIYQNEKAGIAFFNACTAVITENDIHDNVGAAGIFTGTWPEIFPNPNPPPMSIKFIRDNGPVMLTVERNKIYNNFSGLRLDHASGTIANNLIHHNARTGIRFSGNDVAPYAPFSAPWGISSITNNTVAENGSFVIENRQYGAGIYYDDINNISGRSFSDPPLANEDQSQDPTFIQNNILAFNARTGVRDAICAASRDYNLYFDNNSSGVFVPPQIQSCATSTSSGWAGNPGEIFTDPLFINRLEFRLQSGSPAKTGANDGGEMGAYGGSTPITW